MSEPSIPPPSPKLSIEEADAEYVIMDNLDHLQYEGEVRHLWKEDKYGHFYINTYIKLPIVKNEDISTGTFEKYKISTVQFSWNEKLIRKNDQLSDFIKKLEQRIVYKIDNIRKWCTDNIEISFQSNKDSITIWRCDSNPFIENHYVITDELIQVLKNMRDWMLKNTETYNKSPKPMVLVIGEGIQKA